MKGMLIISFLLLSSYLAFGQDSTVIHLWEKQVPGLNDKKHPAIVTENHSNHVTRLTDVTDPTMTVFQPDSSVNRHAAVLVCPGGAYKILAINLEGYEIAHWLNSMGITAFVLQYRVPDQQKGALQDAQRALRLIRFNASKWNINPQKIGVMGFSAGGSLSARLSTEYDTPHYPAKIKADQVSAKPNFSLLIYPAYLDQGSDHTLTPELTIDSTTPPMFIFQTADDPYGHSSLVMAEALRENKIPVEFHLYPKGHHGYGMRKDNPAGKTWPELAKKWLLKRLK